MTSTAKEVAMMIKLGNVINIAEHDLGIVDILPYINCSRDKVANSGKHSYISVKLAEDISFIVDSMIFEKGDTIMLTETKED